jgi:phosphatidyl-myo-inositol dimannoside synthase
VRSILIYSAEFLPFKGGVARYSADMAAMLSDDGFARIAVLTETENLAGDDDAAYPYRVVRVPLKRYARRWMNLGADIVSSLAVILRARRDGFDWLVVTGKRSVYSVAFFHWCLGRTKVAVVLHGSEWWDLQDPRTWRGRMLRRAVLTLCASARIILMPSRYTMARFLEVPEYPSGNTRLLYPVVDPNRVRGDHARIQSYRREYFSPPVFSLITVARLTPRKGQDHVLKALGRMAREGIGRFRYFIVGSGWYKTSLERLIAAERLDDRVVMLDGLGDTDAYSLVSLCDLFVMPNREYQGTVEGFGIAFLEANVLGVPALAGKSWGSTDAVQDGANGLVCEGDDPDDVYRKIRLYHDDLTLRARLRASCRDHVLERFSSEKRRAEYQAAFAAGECRGSVHTEPRHSDGAQGTVS